MSQGTRQQFTDWLQLVKYMTYTKYTKLDVKTKQAIQKEYRGK